MNSIEKEYCTDKRMKNDKKKKEVEMEAPGPDSVFGHLFKLFQKMSSIFGQGNRRSKSKSTLS